MFGGMGLPADVYHYPYSNYVCVYNNDANACFNMSSVLPYDDGTGKYILEEMEVFTIQYN